MASAKFYLVLWPALLFCGGDAETHYYGLPFYIKTAPQMPKHIVSASISHFINEMRNGAEEDWTPDPLHAMQVLSQLSYSPKKIFNVKICPRVHKKLL